MAKLLINTKELEEMLSVSRKTAIKIGNQANARVQIGRSVRWIVSNIEAYLKERTCK